MEKDSKPNRASVVSVGEQRYRMLVETMGDGLSTLDEQQCTSYVNETLCQMWGRSRDEIIGVKVYKFLDDRNKKIFFEQLEKRKKGLSDPYEIDWLRKDGTTVHTIMTPTPFFDNQGKFKGSFAIITDISKQKREKNQLELRVHRRTQELENKTRSLEEVNTALRVLLKEREKDKTRFEEQMLLNVRELIIPYIERMRSTNLDTQQQGFLDIMESTLNDIVSPFLHRLSLQFSHLTPSEIQVANLVKHGKSTKEIAQILGLSDKTIEFYRKRIRQKVGITNQGINLRTYLISIQ